MQGMSKLPKALEGLKRSVETYPSLVEELMELEQTVYDRWGLILDASASQAYEAKLRQARVKINQIERSALKRMGTVFNSLRRMSQGSSDFLTSWIWTWNRTTTTTSTGATTISTSASTSVTVQPTNITTDNESNSRSIPHTAKEQVSISEAKFEGQNREGQQTITNSTTIVIQSPSPTS